VTGAPSHARSRSSRTATRSRTASSRLYPETGSAYSVGVTGPPGVGKSTLVSALDPPRARRLERIGVVSVDPSSPFTHGALLGDRIRLSDHFLDPDVFIRSMGTRGHLGGLAEATLQALLVLDAAGKDIVFLETVGAGQSEVEVIGIADTVLLVLMPGSGDAVQALKAGSWRSRRDRDQQDGSPGGEDDAQRGALDPRARSLEGAATGTRRSSSPRRCARARPELWEKVEEHRAFLEQSGQLEERRRRTSHARSSPSPRAGRPPPRAGGCRRRRAAAPARRGAGTRARPADGGARDTREGLPDSRWRQRRHPGYLRSSARASGSTAVARVTPVYPSETFSRLAGRPVSLKAENLQRTGSFKIRGAYVKLSSLEPEQLAAGVVAASAGNHGQAVAWAARELGAPATVFMPQDSPMAKFDATRNYGRISSSAPARRSRSRWRQRSRTSTRRRHFHPPVRGSGRDLRPGTIGLELAEQVAELDTVVIPIGGGGLASGISLALRAVRPGLRIVGVRAAGTMAGGAGHTIADGIAVKEPGELSTSILEETLDDIVSVDDEQIAEAIVLLAERTKLVVEGAGAVGVAAILGGLAAARGLRLRSCPAATSTRRSWCRCCGAGSP
jgi:threonine dehydratase/Ni2+-binding GTPase involved in maturation of urease and hydrogenase